ncbi:MULTISPECIES: hydrogenase maturation protease [unclassified Saccharicrinis]|uniref:hydrogenase maturation protease n=1 Tax=unclassified Saccharicrinis TaxID=2646859 RepID=UPI003D35323B
MIEFLNELVGLDKKILFAGIGNVLKKDDGVGVFISKRISSSRNINALTVEVSIENYIGKINSLSPDILVLIDCVHFNRQPGYFELLDLDKIQDFTTNTHNISLKKIKELFHVPIILVLGIQPKTVDFGEEVSADVLQAANQILDMINID